MNPFWSGISFAVLTGICWATLAIGLKYALHFTSTGSIVWFRMIVAFSTLCAAYVFRRPEAIKTVFLRPPLRVVIAGLFLSCNYYAYMKGLELTSASNAQVMIQLGPLTLLFMGVFYFKETLHWKQWIGIAVASVGFIFYNWDQLLVSLKNSDLYVTGNLWIIFASVTWAIFAALQKLQLTRGWSPQMINLLVYFICALALTPLAQFREFDHLSLWQWTVLVALGLNTVIAYGALGEAFSRIPASYVSLIIAVNPLLTILLVGLITQNGLTFISPEPMMWRGYLGAGFVVAGVGAAISLRPRR